MAPPAALERAHVDDDAAAVGLQQRIGGLAGHEHGRGVGAHQGFKRRGRQRGGRAVGVLTGVVHQAGDAA
ncbi:hypothetical protein G6F57_023741 [Rhizopus arrhizus]|nr:hypothetical protein G6F57_023741 [Rhizopus arrhizus]